jgi:endonuclease III
LGSGPAVTQITRALEAAYGTPDLGNQLDPTDELVLILLSLRASETKYMSSFSRLKKRYQSWEEALAAPDMELAELIKPCGLAAQKTHRMKAALAAIKESFGVIDLSRLRSVGMGHAEKFLTGIPGVGRKSARCVMLFSLDMPRLPLDTHTLRLCTRLAWIKSRESLSAAYDTVDRILPGDCVKSFHVNAIAHGRSRCHAIHPSCGACPLTSWCQRPSLV